MKKNYRDRYELLKVENKKLKAEIEKLKNDYADLQQTHINEITALVVKGILRGIKGGK